MRMRCHQKRVDEGIQPFGLNEMPHIKGLKLG